MKNIALITVAAAWMMMAASCGQNTARTTSGHNVAGQADAAVRDEFLIVPGERAGLFVLNRKYRSVESLYKDVGFIEKSDKESNNITIERNDEEALYFRAMQDTGCKPIPHSAGDWININSPDFRTAENTGVGSSLQELINVYKNYGLSLEYEDEKYTSVDKMLNEDLTDGICICLSCRDDDGKATGLSFYVSLKISDDRTTIKKESQVYMVQVFVRDLYARNAISPQQLNANELPGEIGYQGDFVEAYRYIDKTGENIVLTAETEVMEWEEATDDSPATSNKDVYAYRFLKKGNDWEEIWKVYDQEFECINDPVAQIVRGALSITDLNGDGVAEIWMMYLKSCHGDVSPDNMFLRMYDDEEVYTATGTTKLKTTFGIMGGDYTLDNNFLSSGTPSVFVEYAKALWEKHSEGK